MADESNISSEQVLGGPDSTGADQTDSADARRKEFKVLFISYSLIIIGTMLWSGFVTKRSVYDKYLVKLEGVSFPVSNLDSAISFYQDTLSFSPIAPLPGESAGITTAPQAGFLLPDRRKLFLSLIGNSGTNPAVVPHPTLVLRVRNGFSNLHNEFARRISKLAALEQNNAIPDRPSVSDITLKPWGEEFSIKDKDGNEVIFFQPKKKSATRLSGS